MVWFRQRICLNSAKGFEVSTLRGSGRFCYQIQTALLSMIFNLLKLCLLEMYLLCNETYFSNVFFFVLFYSNWQFIRLMLARIFKGKFKQLTFPSPRCFYFHKQIKNVYLTPHKACDPESARQLYGEGPICHTLLHRS